MKTFVVDAVNFRKDWKDNGPMVPGLDPMDAVDRLKKFQQMFEVRKRKWENYSSGEELFGVQQIWFQQIPAVKISKLNRIVYRLIVVSL